MKAIKLCQCLWDTYIWRYSGSCMNFWPNFNERSYLNELSTFLAFWLFAKSEQMNKALPHYIFIAACRRLVFLKHSKRKLRSIKVIALSQLTRYFLPHMKQCGLNLTTAPYINAPYNNNNVKISNCMLVMLSVPSRPNNIANVSQSWITGNHG